ncbi:MAG TPA: DUF523 domain-containing protein, partial [Pseudobacteroides sp.]|nr:DUF523 domain-containing protein [Pseudobacteroides sp.]
MIIVSACLAGINCKYDGGNNADDRIIELVSKGQAIPVCPEQLGGCPTPRLKTEIVNGSGADVLDSKGRVIREDGRDMTAELLKGAQETLKIALLLNAKKAILKSKSPSCGCGKVYDGTFSKKLTDGNGVTSELLLR